MPGAWSGSRLAIAGLLVANGVPLVGVAAFGWDLHSLLVIYWLESAVVGIESLAKILRAKGEDDLEELPAMTFNERPVKSFVGRSNRAVAVFFAGHYGVFWVVHGVFVLLFPSMFTAMRFASPRIVAVATVSLALYHALSYRLNFVGEREYAASGPVTLMVEPYRRVFVLHATVVLGAFGVAWMGAPIGALVVMVVAKTVLDLRGHWKEHDRARQRLPDAPATAE